MSGLNIYNQEYWHYYVLSEVWYDVDIGEYQTYGITVNSPDYTMTIHDVSVNEEDIIQMVKLFTEYLLFPVHFQDAVEDMLCDCCDFDVSSK